MEQIQLYQLANNSLPNGVAPHDSLSPFSFLEWKSRRETSNEALSHSQYNRYVIKWFKDNQQKAIDSKFILRQKYLYLLDQLYLFFTDEEKSDWYNKISVYDEKELLLSIPYFAKKLKDIALYYLRLRNKLKNTKLRYNMVGTSVGLEQEIYNYFLETFSSLNNELDTTIKKTIPDFSDIRSTLNVKIEELYDDNLYLGRSPTASLSGYVDLFHEPTAEFFKTKNIVLSSADWVFNSFSTFDISNIDSFISSLTGNIFEQTDENLYRFFIEKYLSENKFMESFDSSSSALQTSDISLNEGNNFFFYPYGSLENIASIDTIQPVSLSSLQTTGATAGKTIEEADTIFVKNGKEVKAAWYRYVDYIDSEKTSEAYIAPNTNTSFIFPYPGYGLSGEDFSWTGSDFSTNEQYPFLSQELKMAVQQTYWSQTLPNDSCREIFINNSTVTENGAYPTKNSETSDKIYVRTERSTDTTIPLAELAGAWLYRFDKTSIPVSLLNEDVILWPYDILTTEEQTSLPDHLQNFNFNGTCTSISASELNNSYFIAADEFETADKIYKLNSPADKTIDATECCWLSSSSIINNVNKAIKQDGVSLLLNAGEVTRFVWCGPTAPLSATFVSVNHQPDCPYVTTSTILSGAGSPQTCRCKQVYYSPFGHFGNTFEEYNSYCDFICEDSTNTFTEFDLGSWKDTIGQKANTSTEFAWYKTNNKHGWEKGQWSNGNGTPSALTLIPGKAYFYKRTSSRTSSETFPPYVVLKKFANSKNTKWIEASKNLDGTWSSTGSSSYFKLNAGDFIKIERQQNTTSYYLSSILIPNESANKGSSWATLDYIALNSEASTSYISWPFDDTGSSQSPPTTFADLSAILWWKVVCVQNPTISAQLFSTYQDTQTGTVVNLITNSSITESITSVDQAPTYTRIYDNKNFFSFTPNTTGTFAFSVLAVTNNQTQYYLNSSTIPLLSVVPQNETEFVEVAIQTPAPAFLLEQKLSGWNYSSVDVGAKPYWAKLHTDKSLSTKSKGVYSWGYIQEYVNDYIPYTTPKISPLKLSYGSSIIYDRKRQAFWWNQPITYKTFSDTNLWSKIDFSTATSSVLSSIFETQVFNQVEVYPTLSASDIILTNYMNGMPLEMYYYANQSFVWTVSTTTFLETTTNNSVLSLEYVGEDVQMSAPNRFYPTIATVPTLEYVYTSRDVGGYFVPQHLGASQFINKNFTASQSSTNLSGQQITEDTNIHIGGRGLTKQDQFTNYTWSENNQWMKENPTTGKLAGSVSKKLTKTLQTFTPYQSNNEEVAFGLVTPRSKNSPWGGPYGDQWIDVANEPKSFTGVRNVSAWSASQILKQNKLMVDCWSTDVFGNQYGLLKENTSLSARSATPGEIWVRTNNQSVQPGYVALSSLYDTFDVNSSTYFDLMSNVLSIDCFFTTLTIQTSGAVVFAELDYDYNNSAITSNADSTKTIMLTAGVFEFNQTWYHPAKKQIISLFTNTSANQFWPELYKVDIARNQEYTKMFPSISDQLTICSETSALTANSGVITYNSLFDQYMITYSGFSQTGPFLAVLKVADEENLVLKSINIYKNSFANLFGGPPAVSVQYLSSIPVTVLVPFSINIPATNNPTKFTTTSVNVSADNFGTFTGILPTNGLHHINYTVSNVVGSTNYCLTLSAS